MLRALFALAAVVAPTPAQTAGLPPVKPGPVPGYVMIADRNNGRIIIVSPSKKIVWQKDGLHDPDDAFFTPGYTAISTNEEYNQTMALIGLRSRASSSGRTGTQTSAAPRPATSRARTTPISLPNGLMQVADIQQLPRHLGEPRASRRAEPRARRELRARPAARAVSSPNGATPLPDGGVLVTEIGGWVDRISANGKLVYTVRTPTSYPSDAQLLPNGNILVAGFNTPGRVDEITPAGRDRLDVRADGARGRSTRPSLAVRWPNGMIAITDDWHHRVVVVDPRTKKVVWSYGHLDQPGSVARLPEQAGRPRSPARRSRARVKAVAHAGGAR